MGSILVDGAQGDDGTASTTVVFAYTPGGNDFVFHNAYCLQRSTGEMQGQIDKARRITAEQKVLLDKIRHVDRFFQELDVLCNSVKEVSYSSASGTHNSPCLQLHRFIEGACNAFLLLYRVMHSSCPCSQMAYLSKQLCERQKNCRDAARKLVDEMDDVLTYGVGKLGGSLKANPNTRRAFTKLADAIANLYELIIQEDRGAVKGFFRKASRVYRFRTILLRLNRRRILDIL